MRTDSIVDKVNRAVDETQRSLGREMHYGDLGDDFITLSYYLREELLLTGYSKVILNESTGIIAHYFEERLKKSVIITWDVPKGFKNKLDLLCYLYDQEEESERCIQLSLAVDEDWVLQDRAEHLARQKRMKDMELSDYRPIIHFAT